MGPLELYHLSPGGWVHIFRELLAQESVLWFFSMCFLSSALYEELKYHKQGLNLLYEQGVSYISLLHSTTICFSSILAFQTIAD